jgi:PhnB protein
MKNAKIEPYLFFNGRCEEALVFYESTLGAERVMLMRFKDSPDTPPPGMIPENWGDKVMHAAIQIDRQVIMLSDGLRAGWRFLRLLPKPHPF